MLIAALNLAHALRDTLLGCMSQIARHLYVKKQT